MPNTTNFTLPYPQSSDTPDVPRDIQALASAVDTKLLQTVRTFATTAARDAAITSPTAGMVAYIDSNDVNEGLYVHNGTSWRKGPGWNAPWGTMGVNTKGSNQTISSANTWTDVTSMSVTFTAVSGRLYRFDVFGLINVGTSGTVDIALTDSSNQQYQAVSLGSVFGSAAPYASLLLVADSPSIGTGSRTFKVRARSDSANQLVIQGSSTAPSLISVSDIGPAGNPS